MGLLDYYDKNLRQNAETFRPGPAPEPSFSLSATAATMGKAVPAGLLEAFGSARDLSAASDRQFRESPRGRIVAQEYERRKGVKPEDQYQEPGGGAARKKADEFMPDPLTAHAAQQIVGGFTKSITKAAAAMAVAGPTGGAALFGGLEADDTAMRLQDKGVDAGTAWQVGGVVGVLSAVGVRLPVSGAAMATTTAGKVAATVGLGVAGGPISFMAQEGLSREILQRAGYSEEAKLHDPYNPIGLAASLFPLAIGGVALRGALRKPIKTDADVRAAIELSPAEQAKSDAFERSAGNIAELQAEIGKTKDPANRAILQAELDKQTKAAATEVRGTAADRAAVNPEAVDAARVAVLDETVSKALPDHPMAHAEMLRAADAVAAGERVSITPMILPAEREANFRAWFGDSKVVGEDGAPITLHHGTSAAFDQFDTMRGSTPGAWFTADAKAAAEFGQPVAVHLNIRNPATMAQFAEARKVAAQLFDPMENRQGFNEAVARELERQGFDGIHDASFKGAGGEGGQVWAALRPEQIKSATGNSGRYDPNSASLTDPIPQQVEAAPRAPEVPQKAAPEAQAATQPQAMPKAEQIALRKRAAMLNKLMECLNG